MRLLQRIVLRSVGVLAIATTGLFVAHRLTRPATTLPVHGATLPEHQAILAAEPPKPVGWVFGRVMGVPGAVQPILSGSGSLGGRVCPPQIRAGN